MRFTACVLLGLGGRACGDDALIGGAGGRWRGSAGGDGTVNGGSTGDLGGAPESCGSANQNRSTHSPRSPGRRVSPAPICASRTSNQRRQQTFTLNEAPLRSGALRPRHPRVFYGFSIIGRRYPTTQCGARGRALSRLRSQCFDFWRPSRSSREPLRRRHRWRTVGSRTRSRKRSW